MQIAGAMEQKMHRQDMGPKRVTTTQRRGWWWSQCWPEWAWETGLGYIDLFLEICTKEILAFTHCWNCLVLDPCRGENSCVNNNNDSNSNQRPWAVFEPIWRSAALCVLVNNIKLLSETPRLPHSEKVHCIFMYHFRHWGLVCICWKNISLLQLLFLMKTNILKWLIYEDKYYSAGS